MTQDSNLPKLAVPAQRALQGAGLHTLKQLTQVSEAELLQLHGMGPKALEQIRKVLQSKGLSFAKTSRPRKATLKKMASPVSRTDKIDEFMKKLDHPFKAEVQVVREIIKGVNRHIVEEIKWKAPSFSYKGQYLVTFNLWTSQRIHLVFHNPAISKIHSPWLEGNYADRRMAYLADMKDVKAKEAVLEKVVRDLIKLIEK